MHKTFITSEQLEILHMCEEIRISTPLSLGQIAEAIKALGSLACKGVDIISLLHMMSIEIDNNISKTEFKAHVV